MKVGDLCRKNPVTARPFDDLTLVSRLMREEHVGSVVAASRRSSTRFGCEALGPALKRSAPSSAQKDRLPHAQDAVSRSGCGSFASL